MTGFRMELDSPILFLGGRNWGIPHQGNLQKINYQSNTLEMKATVSYIEISDWTGKRFHIAPVLKRVDEKSLEVSFKPGRFIPTVKVTFKVEAMRKDVVCLSYDCSVPVSMIISGAVEHLQNKMPHGIEGKPEEKRVNVYLGRIDKLASALKYVAPTDLTFTDEEVCLSLALL